MLEILEFIFRDFWTFIGVAILLSIVFDGIRDAVRARVKNDKQ